MTCPHTLSGCGYPEGECSGACLPKPVSAFAKEANLAYARSKVGTKVAERVTFSQSPDIKAFTPAERAGSTGEKA